MMKRMTINKMLLPAMPLLAAGLLLAAACKKDSNKGPDTKELLVYTNNAGGTHNELSMGFIFVGDNVFGSPEVKMATAATRETPVDIHAKFVLDTALVSAYNARNGTAFAAMPAGAFKLADDGQFDIQKGATISDSVLLTVTNPKLLSNSGGYLIPFTIKSTDGQDNLISSNRNTFFVKVAAIMATFQLKTGSNASAGYAGLDLKITPNGVSFANKTATFAAYANVNIPAGVTLNIEARPTLIADYNSKNNTLFLPVPPGSYTLLNNGAATIATGGKTSGNFQVDFDASKFSSDGTKTYLLPVGLTGADNSAGNVMYITINPYVQNVDPANSGLTGNTMSRTGWSVASNGDYSGNPITNILDGNNATAWDSNGKLPAVITLDMGTSKTVKGFSLVPSYVYKSDNFINMDILSSDNGVNFKKIGSYVGTVTSSSSSAANPDIKTVKFYTPVTGRYFRFSITKTTDGAYAGMAELNAVQ